jgi:hypothetical protein
MDEQIEKKQEYLLIGFSNGRTLIGRKIVSEKDINLEEPLWITITANPKTHKPELIFIPAIIFTNKRYISQINKIDFLYSAETNEIDKQIIKEYEAVLIQIRGEKIGLYL